MTKRAVGFAVLVLGAVSGCGTGDLFDQGDVPDLSREWDATVSLLLQEDLWRSEWAYDAGHYLMVPLHGAFILHAEDWQRAFADQFTRFVGASPPTPGDNARLARLQYLYLASRYLVLATREGRPEFVPPGLSTMLARSLEDLWLRVPAWQWDRVPFAGGVRERALWKLGDPVTPYRFYRAIIDEECFLFGIAGDLRQYERLASPPDQWSSVVSEVLEVAGTVMAARVQRTDLGGWLFQRGLWADHADYAYAGQPAEIPGMLPAPLSDVAEDVSHSTRWPLWLTSLIEAYAPGSERRAVYARLRHGLRRQFVTSVLVPPGDEFRLYRTHNFMDGRNGVYRWGYVTQGENSGYGPFELSGTLTLGWWAFLGGGEIERLYEETALRFPLEPSALALYVGPNTARTRHPLMSDPASYQNGLRHLIVRLAALIANDVESD